MDALERIDRILGHGGDADDVLREVASTLAAEHGILWARVSFLERGVLTPGPTAGHERPGSRLTVPVSYEGVVIGELAIDGEAELPFLERVAERISTHVLLGWDTGGEAWEP